MALATLEATPSSPAVASQDVHENSAGPLAFLLRIPEVEVLTEGLVASWHSSNASLQSRRFHRTKFEKPLMVTPLDDQTERPAGEAFAVLGHDISLAGVSFIHDRPLAPRKVAVTFQLNDGTIESALTVLKWCRFRRDSFYQSGGQFVRKMVGSEICLPTHELFAIRPIESFRAS